MSETDVNGWKEIDDTVPTDGSEFLVWFPSMQEIGYGFYVEEGYGYPATFRFFWFDVEEAADPSVMSECPSHWHPLPKPPVTP